MGWDGEGGGGGCCFIPPLFFPSSCQHSPPSLTRCLFLPLFSMGDMTALPSPPSFAPDSGGRAEEKGEKEGLEHFSSSIPYSSGVRIKIIKIRRTDRPRLALPPSLHKEGRQ